MSEEDKNELGKNETSNETNADASKSEEKKKHKKKKPEKVNPKEIPAYFANPSKDPDILEIQQAVAMHWLLGTGLYSDFGTSFSAKITYVGPRNFMSRQIKLAKRSINPAKGNWKVFVGSARIRKGVEYTGNIKDPKFIFDLLQSKGGQENFKVRFVEDEPLQMKKEKAHFLRRDNSRILNLPYRIRKDQIKMGIKIPLNPGEAAQILHELSEEGLPKSKAKTITNYLNELIQEEDRKKAERKSKED